MGPAAPVHGPAPRDASTGGEGAQVIGAPRPSPEVGRPGHSWRGVSAHVLLLPPRRRGGGGGGGSVLMGPHVSLTRVPGGQPVNLLVR